MLHHDFLLFHQTAKVQNENCFIQSEKIGNFKMTYSKVDVNAVLQLSPEEHCGFVQRFIVSNLEF